MLGLDLSPPETSTLTLGPNGHGTETTFGTHNVDRSENGSNLYKKSVAQYMAQKGGLIGTNSRSGYVYDASKAFEL